MFFSTLAAVMRREAIRQFGKFCIIGASSALVDVGLLNVFTQLLQWHWIPAQVVSFSLAVSNGFIWNSLWTFRGIDSGSRRTKYAKFYATNVAGLLLNLAVMKLAMFAMTGQLIQEGNPPARILNLAKAAAIVVVSFWNFGASKYWTFRPKRSGQEASPGANDAR